jgi:transposase-like protein
MPRPNARKVERPSYEELIFDIEETSYVAVGRKYGVSDNAIRKWLEQYEREFELFERGADDTSEAA